MTARPVVAMLLAGIAWAGAPQRGAQGSLAEAAERARQAWLAHDAAAVVGAVAHLVLQIPGADPAAPVERAQAVDLLRRYFHAAGERGLTVRGLREPEPGHGYAELERRYVLAGTTVLRRETVFLGFRKSDDEWQLTELRCAP